MEYIAGGRFVSTYGYVRVLVITCGLIWVNDPDERKEPPVTTAPSTGIPQPREGRGLRALVIEPDGSAMLIDLPASQGNAAATIHAILGGPLECLATADGGWLAYANQHGRRLDLRPNMRGDAVLRVLGYSFDLTDYLVGPVVVLGRRGHNETDVPESVITLVRQTGTITMSTEAK